MIRNIFILTTLQHVTTCKVTRLCKVHKVVFKQQRTVFKYQIIRTALALLGSIAKHFENKFTNIKSDPVTLSLDRG